VSPAALAGYAFYPFWATEDGRSLPDEGTPRPYWPGPSGTRFLAVTWSPAGSVAQPEGRPGAAQRGGRGGFPRPDGRLQPDNPGFHTSDSIDYGVCLEGEMWLVLDDDHEARITPGTVVVQRGTRHAWQNRSDKPATMLYVLVGADRSEI